MNADLCAKIWKYLGAATALTALNVLIQSQGGLLFSGGYLIEKRPIIACYYATLIVSALLVVVCAAGALHARKKPNAMWPLRLPVIGNDGKQPVDGAAWSTSFYQGFFVAAFVLLPACCIGHFNLKVWDNGVVWGETRAAAASAVAVKYTMSTAENAATSNTVLAMLAATRQTKDERLWLTENVHDPKEWALKPKLASERQDYVKATDAQRLSELSAACNDREDKCVYAPHDLSEACRKDAESCRGMQWFHPWSLLVMWFATAVAFGSVALFLVAITTRKPSVSMESEDG